MYHFALKRVILLSDDVVDNLSAAAETSHKPSPLKGVGPDHNENQGNPESH